MQNLGDNQRALWYVMVFSGVVNCIVLWVFLVLRHLVIAPIRNTTKLLTDRRLRSFSLFTFAKTFIRLRAFNSKKVLSNNARNRMTNAK